MTGQTYILAAGGTGGHMIPAYALAAALKLRGHDVLLITDPRGERIPGRPDGVAVTIIPPGRLTRSPRSWWPGWRAIRAGRAAAAERMAALHPAAVVGFGGYPAFPVLQAARARRIPTVLHEQNAVLGRVNRFFAGAVDAIATAYPDVERLKPRFQPKTRLIGNPVRAEIVALRDQGYPPLDEEGIFRILVTGGSQGASVLSRVVPDGLAFLPASFRGRLQVVQQARPEDLERVRARYAELGIPAELSPYIADLPERLGWAHLVIGRAGASTIAELTVAGRPAILIPYPSATDDHQTANAREMVAAGGARAIDEAQFTPAELAKQMHRLGLFPQELAFAAACARSCGRPDAVRRLVELVEHVGDGGDGEHALRVLRPAALNDTGEAMAPAMRPIGTAKTVEDAR